MDPIKKPQATNLWNTIVQIHLKTLKLRDVPSRYDISSQPAQSDIKPLQFHK